MTKPVESVPERKLRGKKLSRKYPSYPLPRPCRDRSSRRKVGVDYPRMPGFVAAAYRVNAGPARV